MDPSNNDDGGIVEGVDDANAEGESYWDARDLSGVRLRALSVNICHCKSSLNRPRPLFLIAHHCLSIGVSYALLALDPSEFFSLPQTSI